MPPCRWPSSRIGLSTGPASSAVTCRSSVTLPVSVSTSTKERWVPNGNVGRSAVNRTLATISPWSAAEATWDQVSDLSGSPAMCQVPVSASSTTSDSDASKSSAARLAASSLTSIAALCTADPPSWSEREA